MLFDDRDVSAGIKFADADLLGVPKRLMLSEQHLSTGAVELTSRATGAVQSCKIEEL